MIPLILMSLSLLVILGLAAALLGRSRAGNAIGSWGAVLANLSGLAATIGGLLSGAPLSFTLPWNGVAGASFTLGLDPLSGFFLLPVFSLSAVCAMFGGASLSEMRGTRNLGASWLAFNLLTASMVIAILARNAVLFLVAWEVMTLSSWFLVTFEHEKEGVGQAGVTYLIASQIGVAFLLALFLLLGAKGAASSGAAAQMLRSRAADLDFSRFGGITGTAAGAAFLLALFGFGTKAGIVPLHVWLPEAHPAAPSHVSAVMSGVMIKTGIYGILRVLTFLGAPAPWWGWTLLGAGVVSGILGVLYALAQHDIKRLLAYHSVENIGIICIGLGVGLLGVSYGLPAVAVLGFAGGLLHVANHALFKALLFLGAGAAVHEAGSRELDRLGGLLKRMPVTGIAFLVGAVAICGLPPLNGFVSELLVFAGAFRSAASPAIAHAAAGAIAVAGLALIGGLAAACFTKAFGIVFLGEARSPRAAKAKEAAPAMLAAMLVLAALCAAIGFMGPPVVYAMTPLVAEAGGMTPERAAVLLLPARDALGGLAGPAAVVAGITALLLFARAALLSKRRVERSVTWDCGYVKPTPRMQYTASSFAQPLLSMFKAVLSPHVTREGPSGFFPSKARYMTHTKDALEWRVFRPAFKALERIFSGVRAFQHGSLQLYVLSIAATLLILLVWKLG